MRALKVALGNLEKTEVCGIVTFESKIDVYEYRQVGYAFKAISG